MRDRKPWSFCKTPEVKCTLNYCDENGCMNRTRNFVKGQSKDSGDFRDSENIETQKEYYGRGE